MADGDAVAGLGFDHPGLGFITDSSLPVDAIQDPSALSGDDVTRAFLASAAAWELDVLQPDEPYDISTTSAADNSTQSDYGPPSWQTPPFHHHQQINLSERNGFPVPNTAPSAVFGPSPTASERDHGPPMLKNSLTPALEEELRNIAMPPSLHYGSPKSASSPESSKTAVGSSPDASGSALKGARKRKVSAELEDDGPMDDLDKPVKKTAHNMIEKRYRTNINDKIAALRDSVPSLRIMCKSARGEDTTEDREELDGLTPAHKLNKATVLSKATEYIRHLEKRNNRLIEKNGAMQARLAAFEKLWMSGAMNGPMTPILQQPSPMPFTQDSQQQQPISTVETAQDARGSLAGVMDASEDMRRILSTQMPIGQPYPLTAQPPMRYPNPQARAQSIQTQPQGQPTGWSTTNPFVGKMMVSSLAGLMFLEAMRENESSSSEPKGRGLFAFPMHFLGKFPFSVDLRIMGYQYHLHLKFLLLLGLLLWTFVPSLFASLDRKLTKQYNGDLQAAPSCAAPIATRRKAWLTSIQTVWVPHHNIFLELAALMVKIIKLSIRKVFGDDAYRALTGMSVEEEVGRVKAWTIALESQLAGGDEEICRTRLLLTLLASSTLPDTPVRLMLKALHIRLLLWGFDHGGLQLGVLEGLAARLARAKWNKARKLNEFMVRIGRMTSTQHEDELPDHLAALVSLECDEVLNKMILQRAHNLAFNVETSHNIQWPIESMDAVVEDKAVTTPMDAVAAWWSTEILHDVLTATVDQDEESRSTRAQNIELAVMVAPVDSMALFRATLARAVLVERARGANIAAVSQALMEGERDREREREREREMESDSEMETGSTYSTGLSDVREGSRGKVSDAQLSLACASALAHLQRLRAGAPGSREAFREALEKVMLASRTCPMSLLSFAFVMEVVERALEHEKVAESFGSRLEELAKNLRLWMGGPVGSKCGVGHDVQEKAVKRCLAITKSLLQMDHDPGYSSMSEGEEAREEAGSLSRATCTTHDDR